MRKIAIVYWSGTGNTEKMAQAILDGAKKGGAEAELFPVADFGSDKLADYDAVAFGCPAMGSEELEESEFEPFFASAEAKLKGVPVALFGAYGWGSGDWMRTWEERTRAAGAKLFDEGKIVQEDSIDDSMGSCTEFGEKFAQFL